MAPPHWKNDEKLELLVKIVVQITERSNVKPDFANLGFSGRTPKAALHQYNLLKEQFAQVKQTADDATESAGAQANGKKGKLAANEEEDEQNAPVAMPKGRKRALTTAAGSPRARKGRAVPVKKAKQAYVEDVADDEI